MGEPIPTVLRGRRAIICLGIDTLTVVWLDGEIEHHLILKDRAVLLDDLLSGNNIHTNEGVLDASKMLDISPFIYGRAIKCLEEYVVFLSKKIGKKLKDKKIVLWFSGGKDSTAALLILLGLASIVGFDLRVVYIRVPFLDGDRNIRYVEELERRLSIDIIYESADRSLMMRLLRRRGLPFRGYRWCTYVGKIRTMRAIKRRLGADYEATSDRATESAKRLRTLREYAKQDMFLCGGQFKPIYLLTLLDVVSVCRAAGLTHPDYLRGCTRVSCSLCPYRTILELHITRPDVEDWGLIEEILRVEHRERYCWAPTTAFEDYALWRFSPSLAKRILALKTAKQSSPTTFDGEEILNAAAWIWRDVEDAPLLGLECVRRVILSDALFIWPEQK